MSILLSYLAPKTMTPEMLTSALAGGDILANKYQNAPAEVRAAWVEHMRPALDRWRASLQETKTP